MVANTSGKAKSGKAKSGKAKSGKAGASKAKGGKAGASKDKGGKTKDGKAGASKDKGGKTKDGKAGSSKAKGGKTGASKAKGGKTKDGGKTKAVDKTKGGGKTKAGGETKAAGKTKAAGRTKAAGKTQAAGKTRDDYAATYTEPELRERLKEQIKAGDRGGRPGQWSARKSQLLVHEYEKAGGGYRDEDTRTDSQRHLEDWGEQDWRAGDGSAQARGEQGTERYLPDVAWQLLSTSEQQVTRGRKSAADDQHVDNTGPAQEARAAAQLLTDSAVEGAKRVRAMDSLAALERARRAESEHGRARKTVLDAITRRQRALQA